MTQIKKFNEFKELHETNASQGYLHPMLGGMWMHAFGNASFTVKLLGMNTTRNQVEPKMNVGPRLQVPIKKGDVLQLTNSKTFEEITGTFVSGKQNSKGEWTEITLIDKDKKLLTIKPLDVSVKGISGTEVK
jgi:hypothetical protein